MKSSKKNRNNESGKHVTRILPRSRWGISDLSEFWNYRDVWITLAVRDIKVRYKQTVLGALWAVLQPVIFSIIFSFIVRRMAGASGLANARFLYIYPGMLAWTLFSATVSGAADSLVANTSLITRIWFPRLIIPTSIVLRTLFDFGLGFVLCLVLLIVSGTGFVPSFILFPFVLLGILLAASGAGMLIGALNVKFRDVRHIVPFLMQIWMLVTYTIYYIPTKGSVASRLLHINPMTGMVSAFRYCILGTPMDMKSFIISAAAAVLLFILGFTYFKSAEEGFADII